MPNLIHSAEHALPTLCTGQARIYLERTLPVLFGSPAEFTRLWTISEGERYFDVYQAQDPRSGMKERFFFDVTPFYGRAPRGEGADWQDLPEPNVPYRLTDFVTTDDLLSLSVRDSNDVRRRIESFTVTFKQYSSEQIGGRIATLTIPERNVSVTPVRSYIAEDIPFLHGYRFYKLFIIHQLVHWMQDHDVRSTELSPRRDGRRPTPGLDCISYAPLAPYEYARDFLHFFLSTHQPHAFDDRNELEAFGETVRFAIRTDTFSSRDLRLALSDAALPSKTKLRLREAVGLDAPRPDLPSLEHQATH